MCESEERKGDKLECNGMSVVILRILGPTKKHSVTIAVSLLTM